MIKIQDVVLLLLWPAMLYNDDDGINNNNHNNINELSERNELAVVLIMFIRH